LGWKIEKSLRRKLMIMCSEDYLMAGEAESLYLEVATRDEVDGE